MHCPPSQSRHTKHPAPPAQRCSSFKHRPRRALRTGPRVTACLPATLSACAFCSGAGLEKHPGAWTCSSRSAHTRGTAALQTQPIGKTAALLGTAVQPQSCRGRSAAGAWPARGSQMFLFRGSVPHAPQGSICCCGERLARLLHWHWKQRVGEAGACAQTGTRGKPLPAGCTGQREQLARKMRLVRTLSAKIIVQGRLIETRRACTRKRTAPAAAHLPQCTPTVSTQLRHPEAWGSTAAAPCPYVCLWLFPAQHRFFRVVFHLGEQVRARSRTVHALPVPAPCRRLYSRPPASPAGTAHAGSCTVESTPGP